MELGPAERQDLNDTAVGELLLPFEPTKDAFDAESELDLALTMAYLAVGQAYRPSFAFASMTAVFQGFGEPITPGESGIFSVGQVGELDPNNYTLAETTLGNSAPMTNLELYPFELPGGLQIDGVEVYFYSARFGDGPSNVGYAPRLAFEVEGEPLDVASFVPIIAVPDGYVIDGSDAAAFLSLVETGQLSDGDGFLDWARARAQSEAHVHEDLELTSAVEPQTSASCDYESLELCVSKALKDMDDDLRKEHDRWKAAIDKILKGFADDSLEDLEDAGMGGAAGAFVGGSGKPSPGATAGGAAKGGLVGLIFDAIAWLFSTADRADEAAAEAEAEDERHAENVCDIVRETAAELKHCFEDHCPELAEQACAQIDIAVAEMGC